ncbi:hypothetical protein [Jannaschia formosa]|uniref:hypothetical protein n=1 Tax=Jannaschia formosa TaxID=2259592 RepID=UPI0010757D51|nr:hypothetical protein [Jannaschia formosa]TFL17141.1 hypothetical protein DR046_16515 [Jannaschia formosa]
MTASRKALLAEGIVYSRVMGSDNHTNLIAYARDDDKTDNQRKRALARTRLGLDAFRRRIEEALAEEAARSPDGAWLILSNEHLQSRLTNLREKQRLKALLDTVAPEVDVYLYLRRQDKVAVSLYGTRLRSGSVTSMVPVLPDVAGGLPYFYDYHRICSEFAEVFGRDRLHVRVFDPLRLRERDVCIDFRDWIGLGPEAPLARPERLNESISIEAQYLLTHLNQAVPMFVNDKPNPLRLGVEKRLDRVAPGRGVVPPRAAAETFYAACAPVNAALFRDFEVEGGGFEEGFDQYPSDPAPAPIDPEALAQVAARLYRDLARDHAALKARLAGKD